LVPELFYDPARVAYYRDLGDRELKRCRFLIYDLIPIEYPEYFPGLRFEVVCPYFQMIRRVPHCAFISEATQRAYYHRLLRVRELKGVVLRLGCDGLGPRPAEVARNKPLMFTVLGRVEPSKNPGIILDAFEPLLREMPNLRLVFLGKIGSISSALVERLERMAADPSSGVQHHSKADDALIRSYVDQSRATIFVSGAEGFGLPPVESLWRGTPVIASARIPSLEKIGETGVHLVEPLTDSALRRAICLFLDDEYSSLKSAETLGLDLPTWRSFTEQVAEWCSPEVT
jgi:glycosyltransferase involved in cell wall biosynthesis